MKKIRSNSKKGFTLVELIVVLVILAVMAAMLIPALTGYIERARREKDYQMAATVLTAAQSAATYQYSIRSTSSNFTVSGGTATEAGSNPVTVMDLIGDASGNVSNISFTANGNGIITEGDVDINGYTYHWDAASSEWSAS